MQEINGINIANLPFQDLKFQQELLEFDGISVLLHLQDKKKSDILSYLVDFDAGGHRRLVGKISKKELFEYLVGAISLKTLFANISSDFIFLVDYDKSEKPKSTLMLSRDSIPEKYFPVDNSFNDEELSEFYLDYLREDYYEYMMRQNAVIIKAESTSKDHRNAVGARNSAFVMNQYSNSTEGFTKVRAINTLQPHFGDPKKLNRRVNRVKNFLSPQVVFAKAASFEVWLSLDTITLKLKGDKYDQEIANNLIEDYKHEVLNIDYSSEEEAKKLVDKYNEDQRKMIFEPIQRLLDNNEFTITIRDPKNSFKKDSRILKSSKAFWNTLLPPPSLEQLQAEEEKKHKIVTFVLTLVADQNPSQLTKKSLQENLLFTQESTETVYEFPNPLIVEGISVPLKKALKCNLIIDDKDHLLLYNEALELSAEGEADSFNSVVEEIKAQFLNLSRDLKSLEENNLTKYNLVKQYL